MIGLSSIGVLPLQVPHPNFGAEVGAPRDAFGEKIRGAGKCVGGGPEVERDVAEEVSDLRGHDSQRFVVSEARWIVSGEVSLFGAFLLIYCYRGVSRFSLEFAKYVCEVWRWAVYGFRFLSTCSVLCVW